ncbi:hypothetical protein BDW75DRAFT_215851 [Aspergillus navahoensis]
MWLLLIPIFSLECINAQATVGFRSCPVCILPIFFFCFSFTGSKMCGFNGMIPSYLPGLHMVWGSFILFSSIRPRSYSVSYYYFRKR